MKVKDIIHYAPKSSIKAREAISNGKYMFFTSSSDNSKRLNTYLLDCEGIIMGTGGNATLHYYNGKFSISTDCLVLLTNDSVECKYLYYFFLANMHLLEAGFKGAGLKHTNKGYIENIDIPNIPSLNEQKRIINLFDVIDSLIITREQQLQQFDNLVKSRFIEMFGILDSPVDDFTKDKLENLCTKITDGKHGGCALETGTGYYFVGAREIYDDVVHYDNAPEISRIEFEKDYKRCNIEIGDFLIVNTGATIGKSAIATDLRTTVTLLQKSVALLKTKRERLSPIFLQYCFKVNDKLYKVDSASAQPNLLLSKIKATVIYVPPIELQNEFATFVEQTDKLKFEVKQSLEQLETLKKSLMQQYFG